MNPSQYRFEHLVTQMKWRLQEGRGEAVYQIGVEDNGLLVGLAEEEMRASLKTLHRMAEKYAPSSPCPIFREDLRTPSQPGPEGLGTGGGSFCLDSLTKSYNESPCCSHFLTVSGLPTPLDRRCLFQKRWRQQNGGHRL